MINNETSSPLPATCCSDIHALAKQGYTLGSKIGEGSHAMVVHANFDDRIGRNLKLACKVVDMAKAPNDFVMKFLPRELDVLTKLDHRYIIQIHSILQRGPKNFIFMRYAERGDLLEHIKEVGFVEEKQAKIWFYQMATALRYLHSFQIAHRDLKCENILLSAHFNVKLADFGFACSCVNDNGNQYISNTYCGSAAYASPEIVRGVPYDPKAADVWSLGVILFIMLNGKMPFDDNNLNKLLDDQQTRKYAFRRKLCDVISPHAKATVSFLLDPKAATRWTLCQILQCSWLCFGKQQEQQEQQQQHQQKQ
ncbi:testis-specific serine/threonine-protein kinase 1 [Drosophila grimshawi]|uniref:GH19215 n=1 Tax=Drosophila grimshawi TaxID=7222 RepID=B4JF02_DROGR|nr:testis-specific serine/threonine-protein kinase 1 [Drosophila grimshawi]EDV93283.1 GH19215 [Drosophila grimshawi]